MHSKTFRRITAVVLIIAAFVCAYIPSIGSLRTSAAEDYRQWVQMDARWGSVKLGSSSETMSSAGCLVTSLAMLAVHSGSKSVDNFSPLTLVNTFNSLNAFDRYGSIASWASVTKAIPDVSFVMKYTFTSSTKSGKAAEMKALSDKGYYLVCFTGGHWVFIDSIVGDTVYMMDPAKKDTVLFDSYSNANITQLRVFTGKNSPCNTQPVVTAPAPTAAPTTAAPTTLPKYKLGEYCNSGASSVAVYSAPNKGSEIASVKYGQIVEILSTTDDIGLIQLGAEQGWVDMRKLTFTGSADSRRKGDINGDGLIDCHDLALLEEYLLSLTELPDGISILRECEIDAADINNDGSVDNNDVIYYLSAICN